jgi:hypothetical protein
MSDEIVWSASMDDKDFDRGMKSLIKQVDGLKQKLKDVQGQTEKNKQAGDSWLKGQAGDLHSMAAGWVSVGALVGIATTAYQNLRRETEALGQAHQKLAKDITKALNQAGLLAQGAKVEAALSSIRGATKEQATQAFSGITAGAPGLGLDRQLQLAREIAPQAPTGADLHRLGNTAAKFANIMPGKSANDVADLTVAMRQRLGEDFERVGGDEFEASMGKLIAAGMSPEQAAAIGLAGVEANLPAKAINKVSESLYGSDTHVGPRKTKEDRLKGDFYKLNAQERFAKLASDKGTAEAVLGAGGAINMSLIGDTKAQQAYLQQAQTGDLASQQLKQLGGFQSGRETLREQETSVMSDRALRARAAEEAQFQRASQYTRSINANAGAIGKLRMETEIAGVGYGARGGNLGNFSNQTSASSLLQGMQQMGMMTEQQAKHFQEQERQTTEMIEELKKLNGSASMPGGMAKAKAFVQERVQDIQKRRVINVDAHTE